jgi:predicted Holliday junction resolvase-like endonuclease
MKTIIILICVIVLLILCLAMMIAYIRKLKRITDESTAAFLNAKNALEECSVMIKKDLSNHLTTISSNLDKLFKSAEIRFNDNAKSISEKLEKAGFKVEK